MSLRFLRSMPAPILGITLIHLGILPSLGGPSPVPAKVKETFSAVLALEDIYHNEYSKYAPDLQTLKMHFEVKDSIEHLAPGYEIYAAVRDSLPFLFAIDGNGDSLTQTGREAIRFSRLDQTAYPLDNVLGIDPDKGLQVSLQFPAHSRLKGELTKGRSLCSFTWENRRSGQSGLKGCPEYLTARQTDSGTIVMASLPPAILAGEPWGLSVVPDKKTQVKGTFHSRADRPYSIRGTPSPKHPFRIFTRTESRRKK